MDKAGLHFFVFDDDDKIIEGDGWGVSYDSGTYSEESAVEWINLPDLSFEVEAVPIVGLAGLRTSSYNIRALVLHLSGKFN